MTVAKALSAGYQPTGAVVCRREWADLFKQQDEAFHHGVTYGSHRGVMAAGLATLDIMEREDAVEQSAKMGTYLYEQAMERLHDRHPSVGFVGGGPQACCSTSAWSITATLRRSTTKRTAGAEASACATAVLPSAPPRSGSHRR